MYKCPYCGKELDAPVLSSEVMELLRIALEYDKPTGEVVEMAIRIQKLLRRRRQNEIPGLC